MEHSNNSRLASNLKKSAIALGLALIAIIFFNVNFVYNEAGYQTHIRDIFGNERVVTDVGYHAKWFGRATPWKQAQSVQFLICGAAGQSACKEDGEEGINSVIQNYKITFLGNVDGGVEASTRFRLPQGDQFLKIAQEYRTPENFISTALTPAIKETLQSTASMMSADDYFAGARSEFGSEFEAQLSNGLYVTMRKEVRSKNVRGRNETPKLESGAGLDEDGPNRSEFVTEKKLDANGIPLRKQQNFIALGVIVVEARVPNIDPNPQYKERMQKVQKALADLAIARQDRLKEEEQKLLATARGEKDVEQKRQETLRDQIERTTQAETEKKLAITSAEREQETATIAKQTSIEMLEKARTDAQAVKVTADAEAYAKRAVMEADGALQPKLDALVAINKGWADAASKAPVPSVMMGGGADTGSGRQNEIGQLMQILSAKAARDLQLDLSVKK